MSYQQRLVEHILGANETRVQHDQNNAIQVHKNNYIETGINALSISFPSVYKLLAPNDFRKLATQFLIAKPKTVFDWADYGLSLSDFIYSIEALSVIPYLPELAKLDFAIRQVERCADVDYEPSSFSLMQNENLEQLVFVPAPGLASLELMFPVIEIRNLLMSSEQGDKQAEHQKLKRDIDDAIKSRNMRSVTLWRKELHCDCEYTDQADSLVIQKLIKYADLAQVLACFGETENEMVSGLQSLIRSKKVFAIKKLA